MHLDLPAGAAPTLPITIPVSLKRSGRAMRLVQGNGRSASTAEPQEHVVKLLHRARSWWDEMNTRELTSAALAREHGVTSSYASRVIRLNFLAPEIIEAIIAGTQPVSLDAKRLLTLGDLPLDWAKQKELLLGI